MLTLRWWNLVENTHVPKKFQLEHYAPGHCLMHESDVDILRRTLRRCELKFQDGVILDIGTYYGASAVIFAKCSRYNVYTVDPHLRGKHAKEPDESRIQTVEQYFAKHKVQDKITMLVCKSHEIIWPRDEVINLMLIDGCHYELNVLHEYLYFGRFVRPGGYIAFHDYGKPNWPGVQRVVEEAIRFDGWSLAYQQGFLCVLRKDE